jgi:3-oxoacyl-[acyl-carrier-protein] synthase III
MPALTNALADACRSSGHTIDDLDWIVPSQSSKSTIDAIQRRVNRPAYNVIAHWGNTSSNSIPIALDTLLENETGNTIGLVAVGGGLTSAGAVGKIVRR